MRSASGRRSKGGGASNGCGENGELHVWICSGVCEKYLLIRIMSGCAAAESTLRWMFASSLTRGAIDESQKM